MSDVISPQTMVERLRDLFLLPDSAGDRGAQSAPGGFAAARSLELATVGLSRRCGCSTVASALAVALSSRARAANLIRVGADGEGDQQVGPVRVWSVPQMLAAPEQVGYYGGTVARLAGSRGLGGLPVATVWDVAADHADQALPAFAEVDGVVCVAAGDGEPALARIATQMLAERCRRILLVANGGDRADWESADAWLPSARLAARRATRGKRPWGPYGAALNGLVGLLEAAL